MIDVKAKEIKDPDPLVLKVCLEIRPVEELKGRQQIDIQDAPPRSPLFAAGPDRDSQLRIANPRTSPRGRRFSSEKEIVDLFNGAGTAGRIEFENTNGERVHLQDLFPFPLCDNLTFSTPGPIASADRDACFLPEDGDADIEFTLVVYV